MKVYISMTTSPLRIGFLKKTIQSLENQTFKIKQIIINIPEIYERTQQKYKIPDFLSKNKLVKINRIKTDYGPICKLLPALEINEIGVDDLIITVDDDILYPNKMVATLISYYLVNGCKAVIAGRGLNILGKNLKIINNGRCQMLEGFSGACYKKGFFTNFKEYFESISNIRVCKYSDDLIISNWLSKSKIPIMIVKTNNYNVDAWFSNEKRILQYGKMGDALHNGGGIGDGNNIQRYKKAIIELYNKNLFFIQ